MQMILPAAQEISGTTPRRLPRTASRTQRNCKGNQCAQGTGGSSDIGKAVAIELAKAGAEVVVNYARGGDKAKEVVAELEKNGSRAYAHQADVSREDEVLAMFDRMKAEMGTIDILINNAGLQRDATLTEMAMVQWNAVIHVNLIGKFLCAREAVHI